MASKNQSSMRPSREFVAIQKIENGVVFLKNGWMRRILIVGGLNFDLKSEGEQGTILSSFQEFLNTLDFSVQFFIHSRKVNVERYLEKMRVFYAAEKNELLKIQIDEYISFIESFVSQNDIVSKSFFVVVPYEPMHIISRAGGFLSFLKTGQKSTKENGGGESMQEDIRQLNHRVDRVSSGFGQIGLRAAPLEDDELVELFYNLYNPQLTERDTRSPQEKTGKK